MFFSNRRRVDEDLERIRKANLSPEEQAREEQEKKAAEQNMEQLSPKTFFAMIAAIYSLILPYVLVFAAVLGGAYLLIKWLAR